MKLFGSVVSYIVLSMAVAAAWMLLWQTLWNVLLPTFGVPKITFMQSSATWLMMIMLLGFIIGWGKLAKGK